MFVFLSFWIAHWAVASCFWSPKSHDVDRLWFRTCPLSVYANDVHMILWQ